MTYSGSPTSALAWLAERPHLLRGLPPSDLTACACGRPTPVLVVIEAPSGPYALCVRCVGRDLEPKTATPRKAI